jgi:hypothetical protein
MSTRSVIARPDGDAFIGRYAHWDGYPTCRGAQLWRTFTELGSAQAVREYAIREGQQGYWSSFMPPSQAAREAGKPETAACDLCSGTGQRPDGLNGVRWTQQGCNGCSGTGMMRNRDRQEGWASSDGEEMVRSDGDDMGTEWAYVIADHAMVVLERRFGANIHDDQGHGTGMFGFGASDTEAGGYWALVGAYPWHRAEPDWDAVESRIAA